MPRPPRAGISGERASRRGPSAWRHRLPLLGLACVGLGIATYLTLYQVGTIRSVWDPLFGDGSRRILGSSVAKALPVPDAALGIVGYGSEIATGLLGDGARWRTSPWAVVLFALVAMGMAAGSLVLVLAQVFVFRAFCALCLGSAAISLVLPGPALEELRAALGAIGRERRRGSPLTDALRGHPEAP